MLILLQSFARLTARICAMVPTTTHTVAYTKAYTRVKSFLACDSARYMLTHNISLIWTAQTVDWPGAHTASHKLDFQTIYGALISTTHSNTLLKILVWCVWVTLRMYYTTNTYPSKQNHTCQAATLAIAIPRKRNISL